MRALASTSALLLATTPATAMTCAEAEIAVCERHVGFLGDCPDALRSFDGAWGMVANIFTAEATLFALDAGTAESGATILEADTYLTCFEPDPTNENDQRAAARLAQDVSPALRQRIRETMEVQQ